MPRQHQSLDISYKAAQAMYYAIGEQATRLGLPLNTHVTINFSSTDIPPERAVAVLQKLLQHRYNKWATRPRKGAGPRFRQTWVYCFENRRDDVVYMMTGPGEPHNVHCHLLLHVPSDRRADFEGVIWEWLDSFCERPCDANAILVTNTTLEVSARAYLLKGTNPKWAKHFGATHKPQGAIIGRRSNVSRNLGPGARRALDALMKIDRKARLQIRA